MQGDMARSSQWWVVFLYPAYSSLSGVTGGATVRAGDQSLPDPGRRGYPAAEAGAQVKILQSNRFCTPVQYSTIEVYKTRQGGMIQCWSIKLVAHYD